MPARKAAAASAATIKTVIVASQNGLNLRSGPSIAFESLMILDQGTKLEVLNTPDEFTFKGWVYVRTGKLKGWIKEAFVHDA